MASVPLSLDKKLLSNLQLKIKQVQTPIMAQIRFYKGI